MALIDGVYISCSQLDIDARDDADDAFSLPTWAKRINSHKSWMLIA